MTRQRLSFSEVTLAVFIGYFVTTLAGVALGCGVAQSPEVLQAEAEEKYRARQKACTAAAASLAESRACRAKVDLEWGITSHHAAIPSEMFVQPPALDGGARDASPVSEEQARHDVGNELDHLIGAFYPDASAEGGAR